MTVITTSVRGEKGEQGVAGATGTAGSNGANGTAGASILHYDDTIVNSITNSIVELNTYTLPIDGLATKGDAIKLDALLQIYNNSGDAGINKKYIYIYINGSLSTLGEFIIEENVINIFIECYITRRSDSQEVYIRYKLSMYNEYNQLIQQHFVVYTEIVNDLTSDTNVFSIRGKASGAGDGVSFGELVVTKYKI